MSTRFYSASEAAEILGVPYSTLCEQAREGRVKYLRPLQVGARWRFPKKILDALAEGASA